VTTKPHAVSGRPADLARDARIALEAPPPEGLGLPTLKAEVGLREGYATAYGLLPPDLGEYAAVLAELLAVDRAARADGGSTVYWLPITGFATPEDS
jgi:hypothetical protein